MASEAQRTRLPTHLDDEDPFLSLAEIKLSLRQILTIVAGACVWWGAATATTWILPVTSAFAALVWSWLAVGGVVMAVVKRDGRPYEEHLTKKILFLISERRWILTDRRAHLGSVEDADWEELDDGSWA